MALIAAFGFCATVAVPNAAAQTQVPTARVAAHCTPGATTLTQLPSAGGSTHELEITRDAIWITQPNADRVLRVTIRHGAAARIQKLALPAGAKPHGIQARSSARAWVTLEGLDQIVRIEASGRISQRIQLPAGTGPHGLLLTRKGMLWYAGKEGSVIGQVNPATGRITRTLALPSDSAPIYVIEGRDGAIWWSELLGSRIGRFDGHRVTRIPLPNSQAGSGSARPIALVAARDGAVWFSEEAGNAAGVVPARVAQGTSRGLTTSAIRMVPMPNAASNPAGLTIDARGRVWVQTASPYGLVRIVGRNVRQFSLPQLPLVPPATSPLPHRIHTAPDGSLWYTDLHGDWLGHVIPR